MCVRCACTLLYTASSSSLMCPSTCPAPLLLQCLFCPLITPPPLTRKRVDIRVKLESCSVHLLHAPGSHRARTHTHTQTHTHTRKHTMISTNTHAHTAWFAQCFILFRLCRCMQCNTAGRARARNQYRGTGEVRLCLLECLCLCLCLCLMSMSDLIIFAFLHVRLWYELSHLQKV